MTVNEILFTTAPRELDCPFTYDSGHAGTFLGLIVREVNVHAIDVEGLARNCQDQLAAYASEAYALFTPNLLAAAIDMGQAILDPNRCESCFRVPLGVVMTEVDTGRRVCRYCSYKEA